VSERALLVRVDGELLHEKAARDLWRRFSAYMDEHHGDLGGFAKTEGFTSVRPSFEQGAAILLASHVEAQSPYRNVSAEPPAVASEKRAPPSTSGSGSTHGSKKSQSGATTRAKKR
jgi:hypothetical protein